MKIFKYISLVIVGLVLAFSYSCEEDADRNIIDKAYVMFANPTGTFLVENSASATFNITVNITKPASSKMTISVTAVDTLTTAVAGTHYNMPAEVIIEKGEVTGTLTITGLFAGFDAEAQTLAIQLGGDVFSAAKSLFTLSMERFCPLNIDELIGTYSCTEVHTGVGTVTYTRTLEKVDDNTIRVLAPGAGVPAFMVQQYEAWGEVFVDGEGEEGDVLVNFNEDGTVVLGPDYWGYTQLDYPYWYTGTGTYSQCNKTMNITFRMHWDDANFNDAGNRVVTMSLVKQ